MTSILMIPIITIIAISGEAADLQTNKALLGFAPDIEGRCPWLESAEYNVTVVGSASSQISACAYINYNSSGTTSQSFSLWFDSEQHSEQRCRNHGSYPGMQYFHFYCLSKSPSPSEDTSKGHMYIGLYDEAGNKAGERDRRCAFYQKVNGYFTTFRVAVSSDARCDGLYNILYHPHPMIPEQNKGFMLLVFNRSRPDAPLTPVVTTTESIESIAKRYERRRYILQNFGNRPNPFWRTKRAAIQVSG